MLSKDELAFFQQQLLQAKQELEERLKNNDHFGLERSQAHDSTGELASYDNHPADEGTELYEREKDIALYDHAERELANIHRALQAIKNGTYGQCERCGQPIPYERLKALPTTTFCKEHSRDQVVSQKRPLEEGVLLPPFGKFDFDGRDAVMYDAEDTWQEVARYGTSDTPSDVWEHVDHYNETYAEADEPIGYVEAFENFAAVDLYGQPLPVYPTKKHEQLEELLDDEQIMSNIGDFPAYEKEPYTEAKAHSQDHR